MSKSSITLLICSLTLATSCMARDWLKNPLTPVGNVADRVPMAHVQCWNPNSSTIFEDTVPMANVTWMAGVLYILNHGDWKEVVYSTNAHCSVKRL